MGRGQAHRHLQQLSGDVASLASTDSSENAPTCEPLEAADVPRQACGLPEGVPADKWRPLGKLLRSIQKDPHGP
jgi:hypothetical protein